VEPATGAARHVPCYPGADSHPFGKHFARRFCRGPVYNVGNLKERAHMKGGKRMFKRFQKKGQGLVEYALILVLVAVVVIVILSLLGPAIGNVFSNIVTNI
jgi:pilus assembly protein Flp/PilA